MKKGLIILLLGSVFATSCDEDKIDVNCEDGVCQYNVYTNSQLEIEENQAGLYTNVVSGENLVFEYQYDYDDAEDIADDELTVILRWEIPGDQNVFSFSDNDFLSNKLLFRRLCFCIRDDYEYASRGFINGVRNDNGSWDVFIDIEVDYYEDSEPESLEIRKTFYQK